MSNYLPTYMALEVIKQITARREDQHRIKKLEAEKLDLLRDLSISIEHNEQLLALVRAARCPCCDDTGAYYDNMGEICQCQWCYEKGRLAPPEDKEGIKQTLVAGVYVSGNGKTGD